MRRTPITASVVAVAALLAACGGGASSAGSTSSEVPAPSASIAASASASAPAGYEALVAAGKITTAKICDTYTGILTKFTANATAQIKSGNKYVDDPYKASSYINNVAWVEVDAEERLAGLVEEAATSALNVVTDGQAGKITDLEPYIADSIDACGLTTAYTSAKSKATAVNTLAKDLTSEADNKPWYPRGFTEYSDGIAWKWVDSRADCYDCRYNHIYVVSRDGCPGGVYAEVNFSHNGTVIDWTNDTVPALDAGQKARLEFISYDNNADQSQLADLQCHDY